MCIIWNGTLNDVRQNQAKRFDGGGGDDLLSRKSNISFTLLSWHLCHHFLFLMSYILICWMAILSFYFVDVVNDSFLQSQSWISENEYRKMNIGNNGKSFEQSHRRIHTELVQRVFMRYPWHRKTHLLNTSTIISQICYKIIWDWGQVDGKMESMEWRHNDYLGAPKYVFVKWVRVDQLTFLFVQ